MRALSVLVIGLLAGCSGSGPEPEVPRTAADGDRRPFFWRVEGPNGPSHLLGTFHIGVEPEAVLTPVVEAALRRSRVVVLEVNIATTDSLGLGMQPEGRSLRDDMSEAEWQELSRLLDLSPEEAAALERVKLWVIYTQVIQELVPETESIDTALQRRAADGDQKIVFLESVAQQEELFDAYMTAPMLLGLLRDKAGQKQKLRAQADAFLTGDEDAMYRESLAPDLFASSPPGARDAIVYDRNRAWIPALVREIDRGRAFVAVGVSHLIGEGGVVDLLRRRGYEVTRL